MNDAAGTRAPSLRDVDPVTDLLSRLRLDAAARSEGVFIVEGRTDRVVLSRVTGADRRRYFQVAGRTNVLRCARMLGRSRLAGIVCVADRDFDESEYNWPGFSHLVFYDGADVESMIIDSSALDRFFDEWGVGSKVTAVGGADGVRAALEVALAEVSALRAANASRRMSLRFDEVPLKTIVDKDGNLDSAKLVNRLAAASSVARSDVQTALVFTPPACPHTGRSLVRGKDSMQLLAILMRRKLASLSAQQVADGFIERSLRLALTEGDFDGTPFLSRLRTAVRATATASLSTGGATRASSASA